MNEDIYLLDVNIPMYAAGQDHPYRKACISVMKEVAEGRLTAAIDTEVIQEILYRYGSMKRWDIAVKMADSLFDLVPIVFPVIPEDARLAVRLFSQYAPSGIPARDLIHVAVMQSNQISHLISTDQHFDRIEGITRHDPADWVES